MFIKWKLECKTERVLRVQRNSSSGQHTWAVIYTSASLGGNKFTQSKPSPLQLYYLDHNIHIQYHDMFRL
jgi:hypothetical protein